MKMPSLQPWHVIVLLAGGTAAIFGLLWGDSRMAGRLLPHGYCFTWNPTLLSLHVVSDALIGLAYVSIPLTLLHLVRRRGDLPFNWMFLLFALFIVSCGTTHWMEVWTIWRPVYWLAGSVKAVTAAASVLTAIALIRLVPQALAIPSVDHLKVAMEALAAEAERREQHLAEAERLRLAAEAASRAKSDFLSTVSHEVRTPLNGILGTAELLVGSPLGHGERVLAETLLRSGHSLLGIIDDILDLSKIEANELRVHPAPFDPAALLREVHDLFVSHAQSKGLQLTMQIDPAVPACVSGDSGRVRQVLSNLLGNAIKFCDAGSVQLRLSPKDDDGDSGAAPLLHFEVEDTGVGIAPEARERVFQPFGQADSSVARRFGGTGLGLTISQRLVQLMGGRIDFSSTPGRGSCFWFELPLPLASAVPVGAASHEPTDIRFTPSGAVSTVLPDSPVAADDDGLPPLHVLVVEDNAVNAMVVEAQLARLGCSCDVAVDGEEALERLRDGRYGLVLMDCMLPRLSGHEVVRHWRAEEEALGRTRLPIVALTANALASNVEESMDAGMDDFITKPCTLDSLAAAIDRWTARGNGKGSAGPPIVGLASDERTAQK